jgi:hypothetical protein
MARETRLKDYPKLKNRFIWYIHNPEYPGEGTCIIFHKHRASYPYHQHGRAGSLRQAVKSIKGHDRWQMGGRKK